MKCSFCNKIIDRTYRNMCEQCYVYFYRKKYKIYQGNVYGKLCRVTDINDPQYDMVICHICGKAYTKLQQHIYHYHNMTKSEYCDKFGLDRNISMVTKQYHKTMSDYAYKYDMDKQVIEIGKNTRYKKGQTNKYERSYQTKQRLKTRGKQLGAEYNNGINNKKKINN